MARTKGSVNLVLGDDFLDSLRNRLGEEARGYYADNYGGDITQAFGETKEQHKRPGVESFRNIYFR
jgi:hypothetical protein